jgi:hemolysin III
MKWLQNHISLHNHDGIPEEIASGATHALGAALSLTGLILLLIRAETGRETAGYLVFGLAMTVLFSASTAYHFAPRGNWKRLFRLFDHLSIFVLIAGTYTPIMLYVATPWAYRTLVAVWTLAVTGMTLKTVFWDRFRITQIIFFLGMGWLAVIRIPHLLETVPAAFLWLMLAGGVSYTLGVVVYALKRIPFYHSVWHLFVLGGAICFFFGVYLYL